MAGEIRQVHRRARSRMVRVHPDQSLVFVHTHRSGTSSPATSSVMCSASATVSRPVGTAAWSRRGRTSPRSRPVLTTTISGLSIRCIYTAMSRSSPPLPSSSPSGPSASSFRDLRATEPATARAETVGAVGEDLARLLGGATSVAPTPLRAGDGQGLSDEQHDRSITRHGWSSIPDRS